MLAVWRAFTFPFFHVGILHLLFNMMAWVPLGGWVGGVSIRQQLHFPRLTLSFTTFALCDTPRPLAAISHPRSLERLVGSIQFAYLVLLFASLGAALHTLVSAVAGGAGAVLELCCLAARAVAAPPKPATRGPCTNSYTQRGQATVGHTLTLQPDCDDAL